MPTIEIDSGTFERLQKHAKPFIDTPNSVIDRALDALEFSPKKPAAVVEKHSDFTFNDKSIPNLTHTKILHARINGKELKHPNWNALLDEVIILAVKSGQSPSQLKAIGSINVVERKKLDEGFRFISSIGISVQGQDSIGACQGALAIGKKIGANIAVDFVWREKEGATFPGRSGIISDN
jgi:hypothetical protein